MIDLYDRLILKHPVAALVVLAIAAGIFACAIPRFRLDASADSLVLENDSALRYHRQTSDRYGSGEFLIITYRPKAGLFSGEGLSHLNQIKTDLMQIDGLDSVTTILDVPLLFSPPGAIGEIRTLESPETDLTLAKREFLENPIYAGQLVSTDSRTCAILGYLPLDREYQALLMQRTRLREKKFNSGLTLDEESALEAVSKRYRQQSEEVMNRHNRTVAAVRKVVDRHRDSGQLFLGGLPMIVADMVSYIKKDLIVFGGGVILFIIMSMWMIFRRVRWVVLPLICCFVAVVVMMGFLGMADWRVTVISSNFVSLMIIITISMTVHLVVRCRELAVNDPQADLRYLMREAVRLKAVPCLYTTMTTVAAFVSLIVSAIRPVMDFGMMMSIGLLVSYVITFVLLPAGAMLLKREQNVPPATSIRVLIRFAAFTRAHGNKVCLVAILLVLLSAMGISRLVVENRFIDYFKPSTQIYQGLAVIDRELGGTTPLDVIIDLEAEDSSGPLDKTGEEAFFDDDDVLLDLVEDHDSPGYWFKSYRLERLEKIHDYLQKRPETGSVMSIATLMKVLVRLNNGAALDDYELAVIYEKLSEEVRQLLIQPYVSIDQNQVRFALRVRESDKNLKREALLSDIRTFLTEDMGFEFDQVHMTNMLVLYNNMLKSLFKSQIMTLGLVFLCIMVMFIVLFRSLAIAVIGIIPNLIPAVMVLGTMGWLKIPLDMMAITIAAITIGIGVDNTIHYIHRFRQEFERDRDYKAAMVRSHSSVGRAMVYTSVTIIAGFSILSASNFIPTVYFGLFTGFGMLTALVASLTLLPQLIILFKPLGPERTLM